MPAPNAAALPAPPDYQGASLANVLPSAAASIGMPGTWDLLEIGEGYRHAIVVLIDGLGLHQLTDHAHLAPQLNAHCRRVISAAVPSTTPTGLGSFGTGLPPGEHGLMGASFRVDGHHGVFHPLSWQDSPVPRLVCPEPTMFERMAAQGIQVDSIGPRAYERSGLTRAVLRGGHYRGADGYGERVGEVIANRIDLDRRQVERALTYVYWPDLDRTGHGHGVDSDHWRSELEHVESLVNSVASASSKDSVIIVTADHGMVDVPDHRRFDIDADRHLQRGVNYIAGEPRCRFLYCHHDLVDEVARTWQDTLEDRAWVMTRDEAVDAGFFGDVDGENRDRLGDVIVLAREDWAMVSTHVDERVSNLRGQHGSVSPAEVDIPLIVFAGGG